MLIFKAGHSLNNEWLIAETGRTADEARSNLKSRIKDEAFKLSMKIVIGTLGGEITRQEFENMLIDNKMFFEQGRYCEISYDESEDQ